MTTTRVEIARGGEMKSQEMPSTGGVTRSTDWQGQGATVRSSHGLGASRAVQSADQIADSDLVVIDGMEVTAKMAKELGLMGQVFDDSLSAGAAARAAQTAAESSTETKTEEGTGHEGFDATTAELEARIDAGDMTYEEASSYHTAVGEIALANLTVTEVSEALEGMRTGTVGPMDLDSNTRAVVQSVEAKVTETATASAKAELGDEGFAHLAEIAKSNPEVNEAIRRYAGMRALGRADVSWADFYADALDHVRGSR